MRPTPARLGQLRLARPGSAQSSQHTQTVPSARHLRLLQPGSPTTPGSGQADLSPAQRHGRALQDPVPWGRPQRRAEATYRRRRAIAVVGLVLLLGGLWFALQATVSGTGGGLLTSSAAAGGTPVTARIWVVQPGDTLWGIALATGARGDIRPWVDRLSAQTGGRPLVVGERILLP